MWIGIPEVLLETILPSLRNFSIFSNTCFLMSKRSTTTSMIQSASLIFSKSSVRFPVLTLFMKSFLYKEAGLDFKVALSASLTIRFLTFGCSKLKPAFSSASLNLKGAMSSKSTSSPMFAMWQAIREPMIPEPTTATFCIVCLVFML